jgi:histidine triad (HIT) family protein
MSSVFKKIIDGDIPAYKVAENDEFLAFLDISPLVEGHTLVIPKKETDFIFDMEDDALGKLMQFAKIVANKMNTVFDCKRIGVSVIGLEVPHAHIHLIPINEVGDMDFKQPKLSLPKERMEHLAKLIIEA